MKNPQQPLPAHWAVRFFSIWTGQAFSLFGSALVQFALVWWLTQKTGSATILAAATLAGMLPQIVLGPFAGALVDRWNRRIIMIAADASIAAFTLLLAYLFAIGKVETWHVFAIMAVRSLGGAFHFPAMSASTPLMVPEKHLTRISGLNQTLQGLMTLIAPPVGALLISVLPTQSVLFIDLGTAALAILPLLFLSIPQPVREDAGKTEKVSLLGDVREGLAYVRSWPGLVAILFMALFLNFLLTPTGALMPLLVTKFFGKGALEFGLMDSAWGFGVIAGGIILGVWGGFKKKVATSMMGIMGIGLGITLVGFVPANMFPLALAGMAFSGVMNPITNGPLGALLQTIVRKDMQGRVMSLVNSGATAMTPLGLLIAGPVSDVIGIRTWFWVAGIISLLMGLAGFFIPMVMTVENNHGKEDVPEIQNPSVLSAIE
ncbi:MAG: MFS transporter [Chloroflexi bacterium]|nr:MFS transporter [Chloroflexota bacterium]